MIPREIIREWRAQAPWARNAYIEQDLIISRALVEMFEHPLLAEELAFRGGTALYKLYLGSGRYSEDIDLVQVEAKRAGPMMFALRDVLEPWLGKAEWKQNKGRVTLYFRYPAGDESSGDTLPERRRLKIETNSREHFSVFGLKKVPFSVESRWFSGSSEILTYELDELLGSKLRALYQRKKGRDLFDLATALNTGKVDPDRIVTVFDAHREFDQQKGPTRAQFERNLAEKLQDTEFISGVYPLLPEGRTWQVKDDARTVLEQLIVLFPGKPWKGDLEQVLANLVSD